MNHLNPKKIIGVDPGTCVTGYGVISLETRRIEPLDFGAIRPPRTKPLSTRYHILFEEMERLLERFAPDALAVESQFVYKNPQTALKLGMAKGMIILAAERAKIPIFEYAPTKAKLAVVGTGTASKHQVTRMIQALLHLSEPPTPEDAADALALAICHAHTIRRSYV